MTDGERMLMQKPKILDSRYQLVAEIGRGPMATVYKAIDHENDRQVVVKIFLSHFLWDPNFAIRFRQHLKTSVKIDHENVAAILDYGLVDGVYYLVMEALHGLTLRTVIAEQGALSSAHAVHIAQQICAAVQTIHDHGLVHRDLKPENILLLPDGQVKVTDVGLTSLLSETGLSKTDVMVNGVGYMSPEQAQGKAVGPQSDIYNIGVLLYEMLTERLPFESSDAWQVVKMHAQDTPPSPHDLNPKVPLGLSQTVERALQKEPSDRFTSASEMETALAELPQSEGFWWHKLPVRIHSKESATLLTNLVIYRQQALSYLKQLSANIQTTVKRAPASRRLLLLQYLASFLFAFVILFAITGHMGEGNARAADIDDSHQFMINAHRLNDRRDQLPKQSVLPLALTSTVSQSMDNSQIDQVVETEPVMNIESAKAAPAAPAGGGAQKASNQSGNEKNDKANGKAKGKDNQGGKDDDKGKKKGQENKGKGNNNGKGKGASGKNK